MKTTLTLFVNAFQPSFKLAGKERDGAQVRKRYHPPATPCDRLLADPRTSEVVRARVEALRADLDPVRLLADIRNAQRTLEAISDQIAASPPDASYASGVGRLVLMQFGRVDRARVAR